MLGGRGQGGSVLAQNWLDLTAERAVDQQPDAPPEQRGCSFRAARACTRLRC